MRINIEIKATATETVKLKVIGERLTRELIDSGFSMDIECLGLLQQLLCATGADVLRIQEESRNKQI